MRLVSVGEITVDRYLRQDIETIGGISLNFAVHARRCAAQVALVSCVGDDEGGRRAIEHLRHEGVDCEHVATHDGATAHQDIIIAPDGERIFPPGGYGSGVLADWTPSAADLAFIHDHDVIVAPYFRQVAHIFHAAMSINQGKKGEHVWRVADFLDWNESQQNVAALQDAFPWLNIAFVSGNETTVKALQPLVRQHACILVVTLGAAGSVALRGDEVVRQDALAVVKALDTTGCGDAFGAAFTVDYCSHGDLQRALAAGAAQAATIIGQYGAS